MWCLSAHHETHIYAKIIYFIGVRKFIKLHTVNLRVISFNLSMTVLRRVLFLYSCFSILSVFQNKYIYLFEYLFYKKSFAPTRLPPSNTLVVVVVYIALPFHIIHGQAKLD